MVNRLGIFYGVMFNNFGLVISIMLVGVEVVVEIFDFIFCMLVYVEIVIMYDELGMLGECDNVFEMVFIDFCEIIDVRKKVDGLMFVVVLLVGMEKVFEVLGNINMFYFEVFMVVELIEDVNSWVFVLLGIVKLVYEILWDLVVK